jgi:DNA-binding CsgD family transcriptional regulator
VDLISDFLDVVGSLDKEAADDLREKQDKEIVLWRTWKDGGMQTQHMKPLLSSLRPLIYKQASVWSTNRDVPPASIRAEFVNAAVKAMESYDPNRGTKLSTHIRNQLQQAQRFVTTYQNSARIPETRIYGIGKFNNAEQRLSETLGRPPSQIELADELKWSPRKVETLQREIKKSLPSSQFKSDPTEHVPSRQQEIMRLLPYELSAEEKAVFEYVYGVGGKPRLAPGQIAQKLNMSSPKVSRLKNSIAKKYSEYVK